MTKKKWIVAVVLGILSIMYIIKWSDKLDSVNFNNTPELIGFLIFISLIIWAIFRAIKYKNLNPNLKHSNENIENIDYSSNLNNELKCPKCGKKIVTESNFCSSCGTKISNN